MFFFKQEEKKGQFVLIPACWTNFACRTSSSDFILRTVVCCDPFHILFARTLFNLQITRKKTPVLWKAVPRWYQVQLLSKKLLPNVPFSAHWLFQLDTNEFMRLCRGPVLGQIVEKSCFYLFRVLHWVSNAILTR